MQSCIMIQCYVSFPPLYHSSKIGVAEQLQRLKALGMLKSSDAVEDRIVFLVTHVFVWVQKVLGKDAGYDLILG